MTIKQFRFQLLADEAIIDNQTIVHFLSAMVANNFPTINKGSNMSPQSYNSGGGQSYHHTGGQPYIIYGGFKPYHNKNKGKGKNQCIRHKLMFYLHLILVYLVNLQINLGVL